MKLNFVYLFTRDGRNIGVDGDLGASLEEFANIVIGQEGEPQTIGAHLAQADALLQTVCLKCIGEKNGIWI